MGSLSPTTSAPDAQTQKPGGPYVSSDPRWVIVRQRDKVDHNWEWRMPINFYGQVVDENESAVAGASINFSWTDVSAAGSSQAQAVSDEQGYFSLLNRTGRHLQVRVRKDGYYTPKRQQISFDYAAFLEANYHQS